MERTLSKHSPIVDVATGLVSGWVVRITLTQAGQVAYDDLTFVARTPKPPAEWKQSEVDALVAKEIGRHHPGYENLKRILEHRARYITLDEFKFEG